MEQGVEPRAEMRRGAERHSFFLLADMLTEDGVGIGRLRVRNLSATGVMGDTELAIERDRCVLLELRGIGRVSAKVVWAREGKIGLAFDTPVDPLQALKPVGGGRTIRR